MITIRTCSCGASHDARAWSRLAVVSRGIEDGREVKRRRCLCGQILTVSLFEDDTSVEIDAARYAMGNAYSRARFEVILLKLATARNFERRWAAFLLVRAEARAACSDAHRLEAMLASIYKLRESYSPALRVGRNLCLVGGDVDEQAERVRAAR